MSKEQVADDVEGELHRLLTSGQTRGNTKADISLQKAKFAGKNKFRPVLHQSVTYIVAAVLFNERGEVLMTQEGFFPCRGQWYLPAGRVDPNEDLKTAVIREVREETGMEFTPRALLHVEIPNGNWVRFTFTGEITGGKLRTLAERDGETMQGGWWPVEKILEAANNLDREFQLRGKDIVKLILSGRERHQLGAAGVMKSILPRPVRHDSLIMRLLLISCHGDEVAVLVHHNKTRQTVLPTVDYCPSDMKPRDVVLHVIQTAVGAVQRVIWRGLAAIEHTGLSRGTDDGHCLTQVIAVQTSDNKPTPFYTRSRDFSWKVFSDGDIKSALMKALDNKVYPSLTF